MRWTCEFLDFGEWGVQAEIRKDGTLVTLLHFATRAEALASCGQRIGPDDAPD
jgi:hypothetical protein